MELKPGQRKAAFILAGVALSSATMSSLSTSSTTYARDEHAGSHPEHPTARPTRVPRATPPPRPTRTPRPAPAVGAREIALLSGAVGRALTDAEQSAITSAVATRDAALQAAGTAYSADVATSLGLSQDDLEAKVRAYLRANPRAHRGGLLHLLAGALGRPLTGTEVTTLSNAAAKRDASVQAALAAFRTGVAAALSLTVEQLDAKVATYLHQGHHNGQGRDAQEDGGENEADD